MVLEIAKFLCGCHGSASALGALPLSPYLPMTLTLTCWPSQCCKYYSQTTIRGCWDSVSHFTLLGVLTANFSWYHLGVRFTQKEERDKVKPYKTIRCIVFPPECQSLSMCHSRCQTVPVFVDILIDFDKYGEFDKYWGSETGKLFYAIRTTYIIAVYGKR